MSRAYSRFFAPAPLSTTAIAIAGKASLPKSPSSRAFSPLIPTMNHRVLFDLAAATTVSLEIGGGTQRSQLDITRQEASAKRLFQQAESLGNPAKRCARSPRRAMRSIPTPHRADLYRLHLSPEAALALRKEMLEAAPRPLRKRLAGLQPPSALFFFVPRTHAAKPGSRS